jgi:hypothetical protein
MYGVIAVALGLFLHLTLGARLRPSKSIGDEVEYLRPNTNSPHRALWVRVPLHLCFVRLSNRFVGAQVAVPLVSLASIGVATEVVAHAAGPAAAIATAIMLLLSVERLVLSMHLWPDISMGLVVLLAGLLLCDYSSDNMALLALVAAVGLGLRIEGAVLCLVAALLPLTLENLTALQLLTPMLIIGSAASLYCLLNRLIHGRWALDTTLGFNLRIARLELNDPTAPVTTLMNTALHSYSTTPPTPEPMPPHVAPALARATIQFFSRMKSILGPETFVSQNLVQNNRPEYANPDFLYPPAFCSLMLRYGFTLSFLGTLLVVPFAPPPLAALLLGATFVYSGIQTRSRYRMALLPLMAVVFGLGAVELVQNPTGRDLLAGLILVSALLALLIFARLRQERPENA